MRNLLIAAVVVLSLGFGGTALAFGDCMNPGYLARFDPRLADPAPCETIAEDTIIGGLGGAAPIRLITTSSAHADASGFDAHLRRLAERTSVAMREMGSLDILPATILLSTLPPTATAPGTGGTSAYAVATGWFADDECTVMFNKQAIAISEEYFVASVAHELFHCIQGRTFPEQAAQYSSGAAWWVEGSADYFAHLVVHNNDQFDGRAALFDSHSNTASLVDMTYDASTFFLWLGHDDGPVAVRRLLEATPREAGRDAQLETLRAVVPIERWLDFAAAYADQEIIQPGGRRFPVNPPAVTEVVFSEPLSRGATTPGPYVLTRLRFTFVEGRTYALTTSSTNAAQSRFSETRGDWSPPPERVLACEEDKHYTVLVSSTEARADMTFHVSDVEELDQRACCLIGAWTPTEDSLLETARLQNQIAASSGVPGSGDVSCDYAGGDWTLIFNAGGNGGVYWNGFTNRCTLRMPRGEMITQGVWNGPLEFTWSILDREVGHVAYTNYGVVNTVIVSIGGRSIAPRTMPLEGPMSTNFTYQCTETDLTVNGLYNLHPGASHTKGGSSRP
jgi:hypothetical protein